MRRITALLGGAAVMATAGLSAAAPAMASAAHPAAQARPAAPLYNPGDGFFLDPRLSTNGSVLDNQGSGNQAQILPTGSDTTWNTTASGAGYKVMPGGNSGLCLQQVGTALKTEPCAQGTDTQRWIFGGTNSDTTIQNVGSGAYVGSFSPNGPKPEWVEGMQSGFYTGFVRQ